MLGFLPLRMALPAPYWALWDPMLARAGADRGLMLLGLISLHDFTGF